MAELERSKPGTRSVRAIVCHELEKAMEALDGERPPSDDAVHTARKQLKRVRAGLRLLRPALGTRRYHLENRRMRDAARPLTEVRDSRVLLETLDKLAQYAPGALGADTLQIVQEALQEHQRATRRRVLEEEDAAITTHKAVAAAAKRARRWPVGRRGWSVLGAGLERVYCAGRAAFHQALADTTTEHLHEWRKQVKYLWHQLQVLAPISPALLLPLVERAHRLGDLLGDDHDLAVFSIMVVGDPALFGGADSVTRLIGLVERRRTELQQDACELGPQLFANGVKRFLKPIEAAWHAWRRAPAASG